MSRFFGGFVKMYKGQLYSLALDTVDKPVADHAAEPLEAPQCRVLLLTLLLIGTHV